MTVSAVPDEYVRPQWVTKFKGTNVGIGGCSPEEEATIIELLSELLYDRRFCLVHTWQTGDFLIADNVEVGFFASDTDRLLILIPWFSCYTQGRRLYQVQGSCGAFTLIKSMQCELETYCTLGTL